MSQTISKGKDPKQAVYNYQQTTVQESVNLKGGKFIAHLLGLDKDSDGAAGRSGQEKSGLLGLPPGFKLSEFFSGIKVTPNFLFFLLFAGFTLWIFVVYWVRHNEPFANQVLGSSKAHPGRVSVDHKLVAGIKNAYPVQTSASSGEVYVPQGVYAPAAGSEAAVAGAAAGPVPAAGISPSATHPFGAPQIVVPPIVGAAAHPLAQTAHPLAPTTEPMTPPVHAASTFHTADQMTVSSTYGHQSAALSGYGHPAHHHAGSAIPVGQGHYLVGVHTESGTKVKTIVSR